MTYEHKLAPTNVVNIIAEMLLENEESIPSMLDQYASGRTVTVADTTYNVYVGRLRQTLIDLGWEPRKITVTKEDITL